MSTLIFLPARQRPGGGALLVSRAQRESVDHIQTVLRLDTAVHFLWRFVGAGGAVGLHRLGMTSSCLNTSRSRTCLSLSRRYLRSTRQSEPKTFSSQLNSNGCWRVSKSVSLALSISTIPTCPAQPGFMQMRFTKMRMWYRKSPYFLDNVESGQVDQVKGSSPDVGKYEDAVNVRSAQTSSQPLHEVRSNKIMHEMNSMLLSVPKNRPVLFKVHSCSSEKIKRQAPVQHRALLSSQAQRRAGHNDARQVLAKGTVFREGAKKISAGPKEQAQSVGQTGYTSRKQSENSRASPRHRRRYGHLCYPLITYTSTIGPDPQQH